MLYIIKSLKPYVWAIIIIFGLLYGQAMADLALPQYMSQIVNIGIQQNGIENAVPGAIRASELNKLKIFLSDDDEAIIAADYVLLDKQQLSPGEYEKYIKDYPILESEPIYKLNVDSKTEIQKLNDILAKSIWVTYFIETSGPSAAGGLIPEGTDDSFIYLGTLPENEVSQLVTDLTATSSDSNILQSDAVYIAEEYKQIGVSVSRIQTTYIISVGGRMLLLCLAGAAASIAVGYLSTWLAAVFARDTRRKMFKKVGSFSNVEVDNFTTASLITRTTNDILQIQMVLIMFLRMVFYAPFIGIGAIIKILGQDLSLSWTIVVSVLALLMTISIVTAIAIPKFKIVQKQIDRLNQVSREILSGSMVIRAFNTQKFEEKKFDEANVQLRETNLFINRVMVFMMPVMNLIMNGVVLLIIWFGARLIDTGSLQIGSMMAYMQYAMQIIGAFMTVSMVFMMAPRASVSAQRISKVLETEPVIIDPVKPEKFAGESRGQVEFSNVSFKYPGADDYVLHNVSFIAKPGQTTAFIGSTGSGKSTLINLIPRFYDVTDGKILIDNTDIRNVTQHDLRENIGFIPQKSILFTGTIEDNIKYGRENATKEDVQKAAAISQSLEFINASEKGFTTAVAQSGINLSGGQRQRLSIARALAKKPGIYIFDDSFSAVDYKTDAALRRALKTETGDSTILIVAQRISTVMHADQIVVLNNGKIDGIGTHKELMANCDVYRELALSQLSKEELA